MDWLHQFSQAKSLWSFLLMEKHWYSTPLFLLFFPCIPPFLQKISNCSNNWYCLVWLGFAIEREFGFQDLLLVLTTIVSCIIHLHVVFLKRILLYIDDSMSFQVSRLTEGINIIDSYSFTHNLAIIQSHGTSLLDFVISEPVIVLMCLLNWLVE